MITLGINNVLRYYRHMIKSYKNKETEQAHKGRFGKKFPSEIAKRTKMRLDRIHAAQSLEDLKIPPSHRLELLSGDRKGQHSTAFISTFNGAFVLCGMKATHTTLKLLTATKENL
jgi:toxin HigB-1